MTVPAVVYAVFATVVAIVSATIVAWHGVIDGQTYTAIVTGALGLGAGAGIHAAGTQSGTQSAAATVQQAADVVAKPVQQLASTAELEAELQRRKGTP